MHTFTVPIGDWSDDGHGKCDEYIVQCSHSASECRKAYIDSCRLTGYQFHHNHPGIPQVRGVPLCADYEDNVISWDAVERFREHGLDILSLLEDEWEEEDDVSVGTDELLRIIMAFIGLSLKDFSWEEIKSPPALFGYWNDELNVQMGYGCFY